MSEEEARDPVRLPDLWVVHNRDLLWKAEEPDLICYTRDEAEALALWMNAQVCPNEAEPLLPYEACSLVDWYRDWFKAYTDFKEIKRLEDRLHEERIKCTKWMACAWVFLPAAFSLGALVGVYFR
jgi:hypothetical protein